MADFEVQIMSVEFTCVVIFKVSFMIVTIHCGELHHKAFMNFVVLERMSYSILIL